MLDAVGGYIILSSGTSKLVAGDLPWPGQLRWQHIGLGQGVVLGEGNQRQTVLGTNHLEFGATTIGTSENALRIQLWTVLIALRLLKVATRPVPLEWLKQPFGPPLDLQAGSETVLLHLSLPGFGQPQNM